MKLFVRALALSLAVTGAVASTHANGSTASMTAHIGKTSAAPVPSCPPDDPNACGITGN